MPSIKSFVISTCRSNFSSATLRSFSALEGKKMVVSLLISAFRIESNEKSESNTWSISLAICSGLSLPYKFPNNQSISRLLVESLSGLKKSAKKVLVNGEIFHLQWATMMIQSHAHYKIKF